jgi:hypothetical protein
MLAFAEEAGVKPEVQVSGSGVTEVEVRRLTNSDQQFIFVFSHSDQLADTTVSLELPWTPKQAHDLVSGAEVALQQNGSATVLHKALTPNEIWVVRLDRE